VRERDRRRERDTNKDGHGSKKFHYCLSPDMSRSFSAAALRFLHVLVALLLAPDLSFFAKDLFLAATATISQRGMSNGVVAVSRQSPRGPLRTARPALMPVAVVAQNDSLPGARKRLKCGSAKVEPADSSAAPTADPAARCPKNVLYNCLGRCAEICAGKRMCLIGR
jgi:hypothetical protein